jgi:hypothetical protein
MLGLPIASVAGIVTSPVGTRLLAVTYSNVCTVSVAMDSSLGSNAELLCRCIEEEMQEIRTAFQSVPDQSLARPSHALDLIFLAVLIALLAFAVALLRK